MPAQAAAAARACKCDLRTLMVGEFPELQGIMGGEYLRHERRPEAVWKAVKEHYQPIAAEAPIPGTRPGLRAGRGRQAGHRGGLLRHRPDPQRLQGSPGPAPGGRRASCASSGSRAGP